MSGHSKWATIKRQKGANDQKRALLFTKLANAITVAIRQGGNITDPESNFRLRLAIESARAENMPKENILRSISRAAGKQGANLEEVVYEGFGPGGFSVLVEVVTDNKQRIVAEIKNLFDKNGGSMGSAGSVMYQFKRRGVLRIEKGNKTLDDVFLIAVDGGAEDVEEEGSKTLIYTKPEDLAKIRNLLMEKGLQVLNAELMYDPINLVNISDREAAVRAIEFFERLEDLDDVQKVYVNFDIPE